MKPIRMKVSGDCVAVAEGSSRYVMKKDNASVDLVKQMSWDEWNSLPQHWIHDVVGQAEEKTNPSGMSANDRALQLLETPHSSVPVLAFMFATSRQLESGVCAEVTIAAFTAYAHVVENLPIKEGEPPLVMSEGDLKWWADHGYPVLQTENT